MCGRILSRLCFIMHILWALFYIVIGSIQLVVGIVFLVHMPILTMGTNIWFGFLNILLGVGSMVYTLIGKWTCLKQMRLLYVAVLILCGNVINFVILEVGEWHLFLEESRKRVIHQKHLDTIVFFAHTITTGTSLVGVGVSFLASQLTFCALQFFRKPKYKNEMTEQASDTEYVLPRVKSNSDDNNSNGSHATYFSKPQPQSQSWVYECEIGESRTPVNVSETGHLDTARINKLDDAKNVIANRSTISDVVGGKILSGDSTNDQPMVVIENTADRQLQYMTSFSRTPSPIGISDSSSQESCFISPIMENVVQSTSSPSQLSPKIMQSSPRIPQSSPRIPQSSPRIPQSSPRIPQSSPRIPQSSPRIPQSSPRIPQYSPRISQSSPKISLSSTHFSTIAKVTPPSISQKLFPCMSPKLPSQHISSSPSSSPDVVPKQELHHHVTNLTTITTTTTTTNTSTTNGNIESSHADEIIDKIDPSKIVVSSKNTLNQSSVDVIEDVKRGKKESDSSKSRPLNANYKPDERSIKGHEQFGENANNGNRRYSQSSTKSAVLSEKLPSLISELPRSAFSSEQASYSESRSTTADMSQSPTNFRRNEDDDNVDSTEKVPIDDRSIREGQSPRLSIERELSPGEKRLLFKQKKVLEESTTPSGGGQILPPPPDLVTCGAASCDAAVNYDQKTGMEDYENNSEEIAEEGNKEEEIAEEGRKGNDNDDGEISEKLLANENVESYSSLDKDEATGTQPDDVEDEISAPTYVKSDTVDSVSFDDNYPPPLDYDEEENAFNRSSESILSCYLADHELLPPPASDDDIDDEIAVLPPIIVGETIKLSLEKIDHPTTDAASMNIAESIDTTSSSSSSSSSSSGGMSCSNLQCESDVNNADDVQARDEINHESEDDDNTEESGNSSDETVFQAPTGN